MSRPRSLSKLDGGPVEGEPRRPPQFFFLSPALNPIGSSRAVASQAPHVSLQAEKAQTPPGPLSVQRLLFGVVVFGDVC